MQWLILNVLLKLVPSQYFRTLFEVFPEIGE